MNDTKFVRDKSDKTFLVVLLFVRVMSYYA